MSQSSYTGSCLCGAIRYEIKGEIGEIVQCHCQKCRKASGTAFATNAAIAKADFNLVQGAELLKSFASGVDTERCFCGDCGAPIISKNRLKPEVYRLRIGSLDTPLSQPVTQHIYVGSKALWDHIDDDLPQYAERPAHI